MICECGTVQRADPWTEGYTLYRRKGKKRRKQHRSMYLQCPSLYAGSGGVNHAKVLFPYVCGYFGEKDRCDRGRRDRGTAYTDPFGIFREHSCHSI